MKVIFNIMKTGYEICAFLLTKVVERELRRIIFKSFKSYWKSNLNECKFVIRLNDKRFFESNPSLKQKILRTNELFIKYLNDEYSLALGNISKILSELSFYCRFKESKRMVLGWEAYFLTAFKSNLCRSINKILEGLKYEIQSKKDSTRFINLRNLVSHADDIEPEIQIEFDKDFIKNLLEFLTTRNPRLIREICKITPIQR